MLLMRLLLPRFVCVCVLIFDVLFNGFLSEVPVFQDDLRACIVCIYFTF